MNKSFKVLFTLILIIMTSSLHSSGATEFKTPDFAYPRTVIGDADAMLARAATMDAATAGRMRLYAMLEYAAASAEIDRDTLYSVPRMIHREAELAAGSQAYALMLTLEAKMLCTLFQNHYYSGTEAPLLPLPENPAVWSRDQYQFAISQLLESTDTLPGSDALTRFAESIDIPDGMAPYFPDVESFVALQQYKIYSACRLQVKAEAVVNRMLMKYAAPSPQFFYWICLKPGISVDRLLDYYTASRDNEAAQLLLGNIARRLQNPLSAVPDYYMDITEVEIDDDSDDVQLAEDASKANLRRISTTIELLRGALERFPQSAFAGSLSSELERLSAPGAKAQLPTFVAPRQSVKVPVSYSFAQKIVLKVHALPGATDDIELDPETIDSYPLKQTVTLPVQAGEPLGSLEAEVIFDRPGKYAVSCVVNDTIISNPSPVNVTDFIAFTASTDTLTAAVVAGFDKGAPVNKAEIWMLRDAYRNNRASRTFVGRTDKNGATVFSKPARDGSYARRHLQVVVDSIRNDFGDALGVNVLPAVGRRDAQLAGIVYTGRKLYHHGDTVRCFACVAIADGKTKQVAEGEEITVCLYDANYTLCDSFIARTDALGRISGELLIPQTGLSGNFLIELNSGNTQIGIDYVMVSDFKMPTFTAEIDSLERDVPRRGDVTLKGVARTYSGMPVIDATVELECGSYQPFRWFAFFNDTEDNNFEYSDTVRTDAEGRFIVVIPCGEGPADAYYKASCRVVAISGEDVECDRIFSCGRPYTLGMPGLASNYDASTPVEVTFEAFDAQGTARKDMEVRWQLMLDDSTPRPVLEGTAMTGTPVKPDLRRLDAGRYYFSVQAADSTLARELKRSAAFTLYNSAAGKVPVGEPVYVPVTRFSTSDRAEVLMGVPEKDTWVYVITPADGLTVEARKFGRGFHKLKFSIQDGIDRAEFILVTVRNGVATGTSIYLERPLPEVKLKASTFRDNLTPGQTETWTFTLTGDDGNPVAGAAMAAAMYNRALEAISGRMTWSGFSPYIESQHIDFSRVWIGSRSLTARTRIAVGRSFTTDVPSYRFIDDNNDIYIRGRGNYRLSKMNTMMESAPMPAEASYASADAYESEAVADDMAMANGLAEGAVVPDQGADNAALEFEYRPSEVLEAFFRPSLVTDADGKVSLSFEVPQANGQWAFTALAWTPSTLWSALQLTVTSAKRLMVQPALPRFLRQGDHARLGATVFNNSEDSLAVVLTFEIFDISSGDVLQHGTSNHNIGAGRSATGSFYCDAPTDKAVLGVRVRAEAGDLSDGEQSALPVLESASTLIESTQFYLNPGDDSINLHLDPQSDARVQLEYCQNPVWTVVRAMRGISANKVRTSPALVGRLFSALAAKHIVSRNPSIVPVLEQWRQNPSQQALTSMLARNDELKQLLLEQTPWVQASNSSTARMEMLYESFNPAANAAALQELTASLADLQNSDGGFAWAPEYSQSSVWCTEDVLLTLGLARSLGMGPQAGDDIDTITRRAFEWYCSEKAAQLPQRTGADPNLALVAALWREYELPAAARAIVERTVTSIARNWRSHGTVEKAYDILILSAHGKDALCRQLLESIRQHAAVRPGQGMWFPNVNDIRGYATIIQAFAIMGASQTELDAMRRWITVTAQANDDLGAYNPDYVIAAVLLTGSCWTSVPADASVSVNGSPLNVDNAEAASGYFTALLPVAENRPIDISIRSNGVTPSYGALITIARKQMTATEAVATRDLAISKRLLVNRNGTVTATDSLCLGERVTVQLTITAGRDMEYVTADDRRAACLEPVEQLPGWVWDGGVGFYRENSDADTRLFIDTLPRGTYVIQYEMTARTAGEFASGTATVQSQLAPELVAHSAGTLVNVKP